jgi:hypothetical protein
MSRRTGPPSNYDRAKAEAEGFKELPAEGWLRRNIGPFFAALILAIAINSGYFIYNYIVDRERNYQSRKLVEIHAKKIRVLEDSMNQGGRLTSERHLEIEADRAEEHRRLERRVYRLEVAVP